MTRRWYYGFLFIGVGILLFSVGGLSACTKSYPPATQPAPGIPEKEVIKEKEVTPTQPSTPITKPPPSVTQEKEKVTEETKPTPSPVVIAVKIAGFLFDPATVTIAVGTTVTWTNNDSVSHTVTAKDALFVGSGELSRGATFSYTFSQSGTFEYYCKFHSSMKGKVIVGETSASQTEPSSGQSPDYNY